jgi:hypothetical protein
MPQINVRMVRQPDNCIFDGFRLEFLKRVIETSTRAELLRAGRTYAKLYELQFEQPAA